MYVPFETISDNSRLWIYQGSRPFTQQEQDDVHYVLEAFCTQWAAHGHALKTSFKISHHQFLILTADESFNLPSGCSIDSSVHVIKEVEAKTGISFFDRTAVAFLIGDKVVLEPMIRLKELFANGTLSADTLAFNNLVATKGDWTKSWISPAKNTWLARYLPKTTVA